MKHLKVMVIIIVVLILGFIVNPAKQYTETKQIIPGTVSKININVGIADVNILRGDSSEILIEYKYNSPSIKEGLIFSFVQDGVLSFDSYKANQKHFFRENNLITIYLPKDKNLEAIDSTIENGLLSIKGIDLKTLNTQGSESDIKVSDNKVDQIVTNVGFGNVTLNNVIGDNFKLNANKGTLTLENTSYKQVALEFTKNATVINNFSTIDSFISNGSSTDYYFTLNKDTNYHVIADHFFRKPNGFEKQVDDSFIYKSSEGQFISLINVGRGNIKGFIFN
ncbi:MAG: DUF4097 family beta strand repeat-containing protein [Mycoplasmatales bacterium]